MTDGDTWDETDLVIPTILPLGGFLPMFCASCGRRLLARAVTYKEGTICSWCNAALPLHVLHGAGEFAHREGGAS